MLRNGLYLISIGLWDEKDISLRGLELARTCDMLFAEFYTTKLNTSKERLERLIGKRIEILSRSDLEENVERLIEKAKEKRVGLLVGGDCLVATTHSTLVLMAREKNIPVKIVHSSSILSAIGESGLHLQKFGPWVTIPFLSKTKGKLPESVYEVIKANKARGLHTLCLLDVEEGKCLTPNEGMEILLEIERIRKENVFTEESELVILTRIGSESGKIFYGTVKKLIKRKYETPASLIALGILHFSEKHFLQCFKC